ncbi:MAG TPA: glutamine amidotransferase [Spirochaetia bacterium]
MKKPARVLLVGESWVSTSVHYKGFDHFSSVQFETGEKFLKKALGSCDDITLEHMQSHLVSTCFPSTVEELREFDVVIFSDIGANSVLLHPDVFIQGRTMPNRLKVVRDWVAAGGGFAMCGGYMSFAGFGGSAKYYRTPIEELLPVNLQTFDDRVEAPEGAVARVVATDHPIVAGLPSPWPPLLGFQDIVLKKGATLVASVGEDHPLLACWDYGKGRSLAWASDIGPHWCPMPFVEWNGFDRLWQGVVTWLARRE